jgi:hypothetical protein
VDDADVAVVVEPADHVGAHPAEPDHRELHGGQTATKWPSVLSERQIEPTVHDSSGSRDLTDVTPWPYVAPSSSSPTTLNVVIATDEHVGGSPVERMKIMNSNESLSNETKQSGRSGVNRAVAAGLTLGVLGGTAAGLVFGVPGLTSAAANDAVVSPAAIVQQVDETDPAVPADEAPAEPGTRLRDTLQSLVDDGTITSDQADAVVAHLLENRPERGEGDGRGPGGHRGGPGMFAAGVGSEALTDLLGLDAEELRTQLRDGSTLADIATAQGVEVQAVIDELVAEVEERTTNAVENGRIDQAEADEKLAEAEARITDMVNNGRD